MINQRTTIGRIKHVEFRNVSICGHPSYYILFEDESGKNVYYGYAAPNSPCADNCKDSSLKDFAYIEYHTTPKGNIIIDRILNKEEYQSIK